MARREKLDLALLVRWAAGRASGALLLTSAYRYFSTEKRKFVSPTHTPGHERNMPGNMATERPPAITSDPTDLDARVKACWIGRVAAPAFISTLLGIKHGGGNPTNGSR